MSELHVGAYVRWALIVFVALILQAALVADLDLFGASGDIMLLLPIAAGVVGGAERGAMVGFATGIAFDLVLSTPFGLSALAYCITGYAVGSLQGGVLRASKSIPVASAVGGSVVGVLLLAIVSSVVGESQTFDGRLLAIVIVVAVLNAALILPVTRVARWASDSGSKTPTIRMS